MSTSAGTGGAGASLACEGIKRSYAHRVVVDVERLELKPGRTLALLGPSGAGKSTLLAILGLLERPDEGAVLLDGRVVTGKDREARGQMAAAFQHPYLFRATVARNVEYGLRLRRVSADARRDKVARALDRVGLAGWEERSALTLSGGEAQRVSLARALVLEPRVLLLDEPLGSLDAVLRGKLAREFASILSEQAVTTLYVTHDQDEAMIVADDVAVMNAGRIVECGAAEEVMGLPVDEWAAGFLGMEPLLEGVIESHEEGLAVIRIGSTGVYGMSVEPPGTKVLVGVRPEDVLLFEPDAELPRTSARNRLDARVEAMTAAGSTVRVVVSCDGARFAASVSRSSARSLALEPGSRVTAVFKATAVRVRRSDAASAVLGCAGSGVAGRV